MPFINIGYRLAKLLQALSHKFIVNTIFKRGYDEKVLFYDLSINSNKF